MRRLFLFCVIVSLLTAAGRPMSAAQGESNYGPGTPREGPGTPKRAIFHPFMPRLLMIVEATGMVGVWDVSETGAPIHRLSIPTNAVDAAFTLDGKAIVTAGWDGKIREWDTDGLLRWESPEEESHRRAATAIVAGRGLIVSTDGEGRLHLRRRDGSLRAEPIAAHDGAASAVALAPQGKAVATAGKDGIVRFWNVRGEAIGDPIDAHEGGALALTFAPNGQVLMSSGVDGVVRRRRLDGTPRGEALRAQDWIRALAYGPSGKLAIGVDDGSIHFLQGGKPWGRPKRGHEGWVLSVSFSSDGDLLASVGADGTVRLWALDGLLRPEVLALHDEWVLTVDFSADGERLASGAADGVVYWYDRRVTLGEDGELDSFVNHDGWVNDVVFDPRDDRRLAVAGDDGTIRLWDLSDKSATEPTVLIEAHDDEVNAVAFSPSGDRLASVGDDQTVRFWDLDGTPIGEPLRQDAMVASAAFAPDGRSIASGSVDGRIHAWFSDGQWSWESFEVAEGEVGDLAFSNDGGVLWVSSSTVRPWFFETGEPAGGAAIVPPSGAAGPIALAPDETWIATAGSQQIFVHQPDGTPWIESVSLSDGSRRRISVLDLDVSPDGGRLAAGAQDGTVRVWNLRRLEVGEILWRPRL